MMLEEAGYNPFVEGGESEISHEAQLSQSTLGHGFLEVDFNNKRRSSIVPETFNPSPVVSRHSSPAPTLSSSQTINPPSLRLILSPPPEQKDPLEQNPFVNEPLNDTPEPIVSPRESSTLIAPPSPRISHSPLSRTPLSPRRDSLSPLSPRLPTSPLAMSSAVMNDSTSLFTVQSPPTPRAVVTLEKAEWVPDSHSNVCEHCGDEFTFIRRRHHCRVCGHLFCGECIVKITLPATLGFTAAQKSCVRCAYKAVRTRGNFSSTIKEGEGLSIGHKVSAKMQQFIFRLSGMYDGGKFDRFATKIITPHPFTPFQTEVVELKIPTTDSHTISAHAYIPKGDGPYSILVYIPAGVFVIDQEQTSVSFCKELCCKVGCIVISIAYRVAPEHPYPTAWEDCYVAVKWIYESSALDLTKLEKDPKIAIFGESSGGLLAAAVCLMARDRGSPPIQYQMLVTPWLNLTSLNLDKFSESYVLTKELMSWILNQIFKDPNDRDKPYASPMLSSSHANLPHTKIITAGHDPMRNDAEEYATELRKAHVSVSVTRYENSAHGFMQFNSESGERDEAVYECVVCLREVFGRGEPIGQKRLGSGERNTSKAGDE